MHGAPPWWPAGTTGSALSVLPGTTSGAKSERLWELHRDFGNVSVPADPAFWYMVLAMLCELLTGRGQSAVLSGQKQKQGKKSPTLALSL